MPIMGKAARIRLADFSSPPMRAFHMTWFAFFLAFFGWFGIAPLMAVVREDLGLTRTQIADTIIASVAITVLVRLVMGRLCDRIGPRRAYSGLLILGSLPVMGIGLAESFESFLIFRLAIGAIGASFVITQYHTSVMFAPNCVGTANATTAGWGNLGAGVTQFAMPLLFAAIVSLGMSESLSWRLAMVAPGLATFAMGFAYYFLTQDAPRGNYDELRAAGELEEEKLGSGVFWRAARDSRVWALFVAYAACFGVELTLNNIAALYFFDRFSLDLATAGMVAGLFGLMNLFARTLGGVCSDRVARSSGLRGRALFLAAVLLAEGLALMLFSQMDHLVTAVAAMVVFSLFVKMSQGATFGVVPFVDKAALGSVAGIVGAGGNAGAVAFGFLFRLEQVSTEQVFLVMGAVVTVCSLAALTVRFPFEVEDRERILLDESLLAREEAV
jgi:NNP family nitrate/nitrite transporter-like MFS transporter